MAVALPIEEVAERYGAYALDAGRAIESKQMGGLTPCHFKVESGRGRRHRAAAAVPGNCRDPANPGADRLGPAICVTLAVDPNQNCAACARVWFVRIVQALRDVLPLGGINGRGGRGASSEQSLEAKVCGVVFFDAAAATQLLHLAFDPSFLGPSLEDICDLTKLRCIVIFRSLDSVLQPQADTCAKIRGAHSQVRGMFISGHRQWCDTARPNSEAAAILSRLSQLPVVVLLQASRCTWTYLPPWAPRWTWTTSVLAGSSTATRSSFSARGQRRNVS